MKGYRLDGYTPMTQEEIDAWDDREERLKLGRFPQSQYSKEGENSHHYEE